MIRLRLAALAACPLLAFAAASAQQGQPPSAPGVPPVPPPARPGRSVSEVHVMRNGKEIFGSGSNSFSFADSHSSSDPLGALPYGTWWKNPDTIAKLTLSADQQKRIDDTFRQNRLQLIDLKAQLEKEQINLEPTLNAATLDNTKALAQISKIADLRAELEKSHARMLLGIRGILTAEQWNKLQNDYHDRRFRVIGPANFRMPDFDQEGFQRLQGGLKNLQEQLHGLDSLDLHEPALEPQSLRTPAAQRSGLLSPAVLKVERVPF